MARNFFRIYDNFVFIEPIQGYLFHIQILKIQLILILIL